MCILTGLQHCCRHLNIISAKNGKEPCLPRVYILVEESKQAMQYVHNLSDALECSLKNLKQRRRLNSVQGRDGGDERGPVQVLVQRHEE